MSTRPLIDKRVARMRKALRRTPNGTIDLVQWLRSHGYAQTAGQARKLIKDGRVRSESHVLGRDLIYEAPAAMRDGQMMSHPALHGNPRVPSTMRGSIYVTSR